MSNGARRFVVACVVGSGMLAGGITALPAAAQSCDPNYGPTAGGCVLGDPDYDCSELKAMGIGDIPVIGSDWQRLDGYIDYETGQWESYPDGLGCEWMGE
jgi:hypothetical protein